MPDLDLQAIGLTEVNRHLQGRVEAAAGANEWVIQNPMGAHAVAVGLTGAPKITVEGHAGFYCGGMNDGAEIEIMGHAGPGVAENMMSGRVHVHGNASQSAGATGRGGLLIIDGDASSRCGISMKGIDIVVGGRVGHMSGFMAQRGNLVVCGDAGADLGDSIYEARIFVAGDVESLGADCIEKDMTDEHLATLKDLLAKAGMDKDPKSFRRFGSARKLYNFNVDHAANY